MNFDDYMKKIQYIANILEHNTYAENIINGKEIDVIEDFQYICLCSASNTKLVNDIIARIAQNGNSEVVLNNIKNISMSMWKDLFNKNEHIKKIFIDNYELIFNNASILTFREIEKFINDSDTCNLIYGNLNNIIKKLCTYDRASLIVLLKSKECGVDRIKSNLESFFQKGEFDISTTYSKICIELSKIEQITKLEILDICSKNLSEMLNRETAIDNETNKMLNWLYDTFEETKMTEDDRLDIKNNIDSAILQNFDYILDKSNYDKNTIKILKQFDCTKEKFEDNKNHYIDKSNKANNENINYTMNITDINNQLKDSEKINEIVENIKDNINIENANLKNFISQKEKEINNVNNLNNDNQYNILNIVPFHDDSELVEICDNIDYGTNTLELFEFDDNSAYENNNIINFKNENKSVSENVENLQENKVQNYNEKMNFNEIKSNEINQNSHKLYELNSSDINEKMQEKHEIESSDINQKEQKLHEIKLSDINQKEPASLDESIKKLIYSNIEDTDKIIERVLKKDKIESQVEQNYNKIVQNINVPESNGLKSSEQIIKNNNTEKNEVENNTNTIQNVIDNEVHFNKTEDIKQNEQKGIENISVENLNETVVGKQVTDLVIAENEIETIKKENFIQRIWKKILRIFNLDGVKDKI